MNPYVPPANGAPPFPAQPIPSVANRQKGKKQFFNQKNQQGQGKRSGGQSCYNCGSPEHWAQHCPEPRRPIPVGSNHNRPQKRQKTTNGPPGMLHGPPLGHQHPPGPHHGYPYPPPMHPGYPPGPHGPPTPMSAHPPHPNQWQHHAPSPYYPPQGYPPYGGHHPPTPASAYRDQFPSPASPDGMPPHHPYYPPQHPYDSHGYPRKSQDYGPRREEYSPQYSPQESWPPRRRQSDEVPYIAPPLEPWMEELQSLDIDDSKSHGDQIVWHPPQPVARPLPSKLTADDEVTNLPPLTSLPPGMSVSKYFLNKRAEEFQSHIRDTSDWPFMMKDPVFMVISVECETIPMLELISRRNKLFEDHRVKTPIHSARTTPEVADTKEEPMDSRSPSGRSVESDYEGSRQGSRTPTPRDYRGDYQSHDEDYSEPRNGEHYDDGDYPPRDNRREYGNHDRRAGSHDSHNAAYKRSPSDNMDREQDRHHDRASERSRNWHKHNGSQNKKKHGGRDRDRHNGNSSNFRGQERRTRGSRGSTAQQSSRRRSGGFKHEDTDANRESHAPENGHGGSTNGHRDQKHTSRKRERDESPGDKSPRRQKDDVAPKNKIRRPEVAAAYSRRW